MSFSALLAICSLAFLSLGLAGQEAPSSERFRLSGVLVPAAGLSVSTSFRLTSCLCAGIAGYAESPSFRVLAGCAALLPDARERPRPDPGPRFPEEHPGGPSPAGSENDPRSGAAAWK